MRVVGGIRSFKPNGVTYTLFGAIMGLNRRMRGELFWQVEDWLVSLLKISVELNKRYDVAMGIEDINTLIDWGRARYFSRWGGCIAIPRLEQQPPVHSPKIPGSILINMYPVQPVEGECLYCYV